MKKPSQRPRIKYLLRARVRRLARRFGYDIVELHDLPRDFDQADVETWESVRQFTMTSPERVYALCHAAEYIVENAIPGDFVECGVWRGGSMMAIARTLLRLNVTDRDLYLFDTFEGMPPPGEEDVERRSGTSAEEVLARYSKTDPVWAVAAMADVRDAIRSSGYPEERVHLVKGRVQETLPAAAPSTIALLRLDTDWYDSTLHELSHLFPKLAPGGVLIIDDYAYWEGVRRAVDEYMAAGKLPLLLNRIDDMARICIKPSSGNAPIGN